MDDKRRDSLEALQQRLGYSFNDCALLDVALTHTSYVKGEGRGAEHNERLEYLGDAVLELCVSEYLFKNYPKLNEGKMTRARSTVVRESALMQTAEEYRMGECLLLSHGEERTGGREKPSILSDAVEAVIGAIYIDGGMDAAKKFILSFSVPKVKEIISATTAKDFKTRLQEYVQSNRMGVIKYELVSQSGPDHKKTFVMNVLLNGAPIGEGSGTSKQEAGQNCARAALEMFEAKKAQ